MTRDELANRKLAPYLTGDSANLPMYGGMDEKVVVPGVGPDTPIVTEANGAKQSPTVYRCDLLPAQATLAVAGVLRHGADKYGANNWRKIACESHLNRVLVHAFAYLAGDRQDDHLEHMACRALMALEMALTTKETNNGPAERQ